MSDPSATALDQIVEYVNLKRGLSLTRTDLQYGPPVLINPNILSLSHPHARNTEVAVTFAGTIGLPSFELSAFYNRLHLNRLFRSVSKHIPHDGETRIYQLLSKISTAVEYPITEADVHDGDIAEDGTFTLTAKPLSYDVFGNVLLTVAPDVSAPWISNGNRYHLTVRGSAEAEDILELEQTTDESIYVGRFEDKDGIFFDFSDLSDLTFEGGVVYAVPTGGRDYTRLVDSYTDYPQARVYVGTSSEGLRITHEIEELEEQGTDRHRYFQAVETEMATPSNFMPAYRLFWLRFSHPEFNVPIHFLYRKAIQFSLLKDYLSMSNPLLDVQQTMLDEINEQAGLLLTKNDVVFENLTLVNPNIIELTGSERNSRVRVRTTGSDLIDLTINYNRLQLQRLFNLRSTEFEDLGQTTLAELLPQINTRLGTEMTSADIVAATIDQQTKTVTLAAAPGSFGYFGSIELSLVGEVVTPPDDELFVDGFLALNNFGGFLTEDFNTAVQISDAQLPLYTVESPAVAIATGGYNNEALAAVVTYDEQNNPVVKFFSSHAGGNGDWMEHTLDETYLFVNSYVSPVFFKGQAYFAFNGVDANISIIKRAVLNTTGDGRSYQLETVLELTSSCLFLGVLDGELVYGTYRALHRTTNGVDWVMEELPYLAKSFGIYQDQLIGLGQDQTPQMRAIAFRREIVEGSPEWSSDLLDLTNYPLADGWQYSVSGSEIVTLSDVVIANFDLTASRGGEYVDVYAAIYTRADGQVNWTHRIDSTQHHLSLDGLMVTDGTVVAVSGRRHWTSAEENWMIVSSNKGVDWNTYPSTNTLFGTNYPTLAHLALRQRRVGTAPTPTPVPTIDSIPWMEYPNHTDSTIKDLVVMADDSVVVSGGNIWNKPEEDSVTYGGSKIVTLFPDGRVNPFRNCSFFDDVYEFVLTSDGKFLAVGNYNGDQGNHPYYSFSGDQYPKRSVVRLNANLSVDWTYNSPTGNDFGLDGDSPEMTGLVKLNSSDKVVATGSWGSIDGFTSPGAMRLNEDGTVDQEFVSPYTDGTVNEVFVSPSDYLAFTATDASSDLGWGRPVVTDINGTILPQMPDLGGGSSINGIHDFPSRDSIYVMGSFTIDGQFHSMVRLGADGSRDMSFPRFDSSIYFVKALDNGDCLVAYSPSSDFWELRVLTEDGLLVPFDQLKASTSGRVCKYETQSNGNVLLGGDFDTFFTKPYPFLGPRRSENIVRLGDNVDTFDRMAWVQDTNICLPNQLRDTIGQLPLINLRNLHFVAGYNGYKGVAARFAGNAAGSETSQQEPHYSVPPDVGNHYQNIDRWCLDLVFHHYLDSLEAESIQLLVTYAQEGMTSFTLTREVVEGAVTYALVSDSNSNDRFPMTHVQATDDQSYRDESLVTFSIPGIDLIQTAFQGLSYDTTNGAYPAGPVIVEVVWDETTRLTLSHSWQETGGGIYPIYEQGVPAGEFFSVDGTLNVGTALGGSEQDIYFQRCTDAPVGGYNPITAMRFYDSVAGPSSAPEEDGFLYNTLYGRAPSHSTTHYLDVLMGLPEAHGRALPEDYYVTIQFGVSEYVGPGSINTSTFMRMALVNDAGTLYFRAVDEYDGTIADIPVTWASNGQTNIQQRFVLNDLYSTIPSNLWDGDADFDLTASIAMTPYAGSGDPIGVLKTNAHIRRDPEG